VVEATTYHQTISEPVPEIKKAAKTNLLLLIPKKLWKNF
jgi:hypothetical protein